MVSAPYARKKLKLPFVPSRPTYISKSIFCRSRGRSHNYIYRYLYRTRRRTARMARPANARTDTQTGGWTRRSTDVDADARTRTQTHGRRSADADADARTQTQKHGRRRRRTQTQTDADASARWRTDAKYSCVQCVGGKIVLTCPASGRTHKDLRGVLYRVGRLLIPFKVYQLFLGMARIWHIHVYA